MGFLNPKREDDEDEALPGATGLHLDLDLTRCPECRRELTPWQDRCPDCGEVGVHPSQLRAASSGLPDLSHLDVDDEAGGGGGEAARYHEAAGGDDEAADGDATDGDDRGR